MREQKLREHAIASGFACWVVAAPGISPAMAEGQFGPEFYVPGRFPVKKRVGTNRSIRGESRQPQGLPQPRPLGSPLLQHDLHPTRAPTRGGLSRGSRPTSGASAGSAPVPPSRPPPATEPSDGTAAPPRTGTRAPQSVCRFGKRLASPDLTSRPAVRGTPLPLTSG